MKRDANEKAIVETLRKCGFLVQQIDQGGGVPDLLVCAGGRVVLLEVKDGPKKKLTPAQLKWHAQWEGAPVFVVDSVESALAAVADIDPQVKRVRELEAGLRQTMDALIEVQQRHDETGACYCAEWHDKHKPWCLDAKSAIAAARLLLAPRIAGVPLLVDDNQPEGVVFMHMKGDQ